VKKCLFVPVCIRGIAKVKLWPQDYSADFARYGHQ
jgi:hypothetical protein